LNLGHLSIPYAYECINPNRDSHQLANFFL
jgi:hypothetical protein